MASHCITLSILICSLMCTFFCVSISSFLCNFCYIISKPSLTNKVNKNIFSVLFLGWYTHHCIAGNPIASLHGLRRWQPQHKYTQHKWTHRVDRVSQKDLKFEREECKFCIGITTISIDSRKDAIRSYSLNVKISWTIQSTL